MAPRTSPTGDSRPAAEQKNEASFRQFNEQAWRRPTM
jgi:hypothetical protein